MKKSHLILIFVFSFCLNQFLYAAPVQAIATPGKNQLKSRAAMVCVALLSVTTGMAVVAHNISSASQGKVTWGGRMQSYRNRSSFVLFLTKGVFRKKLKVELDDAEVDDVQILDVRKQFESDLNFATIIDKLNEESLSEHVIISSRSSSGAVEGFFLIPGFLTKFSLSPLTDYTWRFKVRSLKDDSILFDGQVAPLSINLTPFAKVSID